MIWRSAFGFVVPIPTFPAFVKMNVPPAVFENWTTFPVVLDPMTVRTFAAAAGVALKVPDAIFVKFFELSMTVVPPTWYTAVPDALKPVEAVKVVPETPALDVIAPDPMVPIFVKFFELSMTVVPPTWYTAVPDALKPVEAVKVVPETVFDPAIVP